MSEAKYTKGPWCALSLSDTINIQPAPGMPHERKAIINHVFGGANNSEIVAQTGCNYPRCEANARLVAAAPALLEHLKDMVQLLAEITDLYPDEIARIEKAEAAVALAEEK